MGVEQVPTGLGQRHGKLASFELYGVRQAFITQMAEVWFARAQRLFARVAQVSFRDHPERADSGERPAVVAIQLVPAVTVEHDLTIRSAWQVEAVDEPVSRLSLARILVAHARVSITIAAIVSFPVEACVPRVDPRHLDLANVAITIARIEVHGADYPNGSIVKQFTVGSRPRV